MSLSVTTTTTQDVVLSPALRTKLMLRLRAYQLAKQGLDAIQVKMDALKAEIDILRDQTGELSINIEGFNVTYVAGTRSTLSKEALIANGCSAAMIQMSTITTPTKPFTKVTCPKGD